MAFVEDLSVFFNTDDFAVSATLAGQPVVGLLSSPVSSHTLGLGAGVMVGDSHFTLPTASVPAATYGLTLVVGAANYTVREHLPNGSGVSVLLLAAA